MAGDFWARKIAGAPPRQQAPLQRQPQQRQPQQYEPRPSYPRGLVPDGMGRDRQRAVNHYLGRAGVEYEDEPQQQHLPQGGGEMTAEELAQYGAGEQGFTDPRDPYGYLSQKRVYRWRGNPRGGASEQELCPACGSPRYFSMRLPGTGKMKEDGTMVFPSPQCAECGYPKEQGILGMDGGAKVVGKPIHAREGASPRMNFKQVSGGY